MPIRGIGAVQDITEQVLKEQELQKALVDCDDKEVLKAFNRDKLIPAKNEYFAGIEAVAKELDLMR